MIVRISYYTYKLLLSFWGILAQVLVLQSDWSHNQFLREMSMSLFAAENQSLHKHPLPYRKEIPEIPVQIGLTIPNREFARQQCWMDLIPLGKKAIKLAIVVQKCLPCKPSIEYSTIQLILTM